MAVPSKPSLSSVSVVGSLPATHTVLPPPPEMAAQVAADKSPKRILAIPSVRKLARDLGVDLTQVKPTGPRGRIRREDVLQAASLVPTPVSAAGEQAGERQVKETLQPLPTLRRTIAEAMVRAASTAVPITTTDETDVTELVALRQRSKVAAEAQGVNVTLLPFIMKAGRRSSAPASDVERHLR